MTTPTRYADRMAATSCGPSDVASTLVLVMPGGKGFPSSSRPSRSIRCMSSRVSVKVINKACHRREIDCDRPKRWVRCARRMGRGRFLRSTVFGFLSASFLHPDQYSEIGIETRARNEVMVEREEVGALSTVVTTEACAA